MSFQNPASVSALLAGDIANALRAATPGGIEAQEAAGQRALVASEMIPKEIRGATREQLSALGFVFGEDVDELFVNCTLPPGWTKRATDHSMNSDLVDEQGRKRANIFYKAAFYDRRADMGMNLRYQIQAWRDGDGGAGTSAVNAIDHDDTVLYHFGDYERTTEGYPVGDELRAKADAWLTEHFPDWRNPLAYW